MRADFCAKCGGVFARRAMTDAIAQGPDRALVAAVFALSAGKSERPPEPASRELPCPECGIAMRREHVAPAVCDIDVCDEHGTWFDAHEFHHVVRALGQARARKHKR